MHANHNLHVFVVYVAAYVCLVIVDSTLFSVYERAAQPIAANIAAGKATLNMNTLGLLAYITYSFC